MSGSDQAERLHPVVLHHVVNTLGWPALRPLQQAAVAPLLAGDDALLLAPTAGGKTEAAMFPLLSRMQDEHWRGLSVVYVTPLRALLNNLQPRLASYAGWLGRRAEVWHGDTGAGARGHILRDPPDVLLTTPESLEAMLVSTRVDPHRLFADLRALVVDEIHAFAGDDRGWHLLAVLSRLQRIAARHVQRVGLSATVGNPAELLEWLRRGTDPDRPGRVVDPSSSTAVASPDLDLDHVGSLENAATVIASLHRGEKRLVFADSRRRVEELTHALRERGVTTFASHSSLSAEERRRSEQAFAEARDCVIVATSTLELGIDVGDLDRVIQLDAPRTVASFLQRLGRTGRRPGTTRNTLFLALDPEAAVRAAALLHLWGQGWVEPVVPPPDPAHIAAQQLMALTLQEGQVGEALLGEYWADLPFTEHLPAIAAHLVATGLLAREEGMLAMGDRGEQSYGRRHFMDLTSVFTSAPAFTLLHGRTEIGLLDPLALMGRRQPGAHRVVLLAGRSWLVTHVDWKRRRAYAEPWTGGGRARWQGLGGSLSFAMTRAMRAVLLGAEPPASLTRRAVAALADERERLGEVVDAERLVVARGDGDVHWWTWAGGAANLTLMAALPGVVDPAQRVDDARLRLLPDVAPGDVEAAVAAVVVGELPRPEVDEQALRGLKFAEALPGEMARGALGARLADGAGARAVLGEPRRWTADQR